MAKGFFLPQSYPLASIPLPCQVTSIAAAPKNQRPANQIKKEPFGDQKRSKKMCVESPTFQKHLTKSWGSSNLANKSSCFHVVFDGFGPHILNFNQLFTSTGRLKHHRHLFLALRGIRRDTHNEKHDPRLSDLSKTGLFSNHEIWFFSKKNMVDICWWFFGKRKMQKSLIAGFAKIMDVPQSKKMNCRDLRGDVRFRIFKPHVRQ